jgi:hypothetical protein
MALRRRGDLQFRLLPSAAMFLTFPMSAWPLAGIRTDAIHGQLLGLCALKEAAGVDAELAICIHAFEP